jgi:hypothetical protein
MNELRIACPNCSQAISADAARGGGAVRCPTCKHEFRLPRRGDALPPPLPPGVGVGRAGMAAGPAAGAMPPPLPKSVSSAAAAVLEAEVLAGGRFVVLQYCVSVVALSFKRSSGVIFLRPGQDGAGHAIKYSLLSLVAGWWGIPWGPLWTIGTVVTNSRGGQDVTQAILTAHLGPSRAAQIVLQRPRPATTGMGLKAFRWGLAGMVLLLGFLLVGMPAWMLQGERDAISRARTPGEGQFRLANQQINMYRGSAAFGNSPKAIAVATRFSAGMKLLRGALFTGGKPHGLALSDHEFLTCCELQETQCVLIVHVPELRRFTDSAKAQLGELAWLTAQQALKAEGVGAREMRLAVGLRGFALYDRVLLGTIAAGTSGLTNRPAETVTGLRPEERLFPLFHPPQSLPAVGPREVQPGN